MTTYAVEIAKRASQQIAELDRDLQIRVVARLESLGQDPRPAGCKKLAGSE